MADFVCQVQLHYLIGPQPGMNVLHFYAEPGVGLPDVDSNTIDCLQSFDLNLLALWMACLPEDVQLIGTKGRRVSPSGGPTVTIPYTTQFGGRTGKFDAGSNGPCIIVGYQQLDGDWKAGRIFMPGVSESDIEENQFETALTDALDDLYVELLQPQLGGLAIPWEFGVFSRLNETFSGAETLTTSGRPGTQRRRLKPSF